jgi:hypothetical protein
MSQKDQTWPQLPIEIIKYILTLATQPPKQLSSSIPMFTWTLEELTSPCMYLKNEFHRMYCTWGPDWISDHPNCTCKYWDYCNADNEYDFWNGWPEAARHQALNVLESQYLPLVPYPLGQWLLDLLGIQQLVGIHSRWLFRICVLVTRVNG